MTHTKDESINSGVAEMIPSASPEGSVREGCRRQAESENGDDWKTILCYELQISKLHLKCGHHPPLSLGAALQHFHLDASTKNWVTKGILMGFFFDSPSALVVVLAFPCRAFLLPKLHFPFTTFPCHSPLFPSHPVFCLPASGRLSPPISVMLTWSC